MTAPHCICLYIHTYIYIYIYINTYTYICLYTHTYTYIYICTDERVSLFIECNNQRTHFILALSFICKMSSHENMYSDGHSIYHDIRYGAVMIAAERNSYFELKTDIPYLALTGELWGVFYVNCEENWPRHDGTALHMHIYTHIHINTYTYICTYTHIHIYICTDERVRLFIECSNQRTHFILALSFICKMSSHENMYSDGHSINCLKHNGFPSCPKMIFVQALEG